MERDPVRLPVLGGSDRAGKARAAVVTFLDYTCPFCYLLERTVLSPLRDGDGVAVDYRAFELWPEPTPVPVPDDPAESRKWAELVIPLAGELGIELRRPALLPRTRKAHEAAAHAREHDRFEAMRAALFRGHFHEGLDIGRIDVLADLGAAAGLDRTALKVALDIDQQTESVLRDEALARRLGVVAAPTLVVGDEVVVGFHDLATIRDLLSRAD